MLGIEVDSCKKCGKRIEWRGIGPHKREYCSDSCRQKAYRERERERKIEAKNRNVTAIDGDLQQRIAQLEQDLAAAHHLIDEYINRKKTSQPWKKSLQERWVQLGKATDYPALTIPIRVQAGERAHRLFGLAASNELLEEGNVTLRRQLEEGNRHQS